MWPQVEAIMWWSMAAVLFLIIVAIDHRESIRDWTQGWKWWQYALCILMPLAAFLWAAWPSLHETEQPTATQEEVVHMMRTLQGYVLNWELKENPAAFLESAIHAKVLAERLQSLGLAPSQGYTVSTDANGHRTESIHPGRWRFYLAYIFPYAQTFGVKRALEETRSYNAMETPDVTVRGERGNSMQAPQ